MIDARLKLSVFSSAPVMAVETFTDHSEGAIDFGRDSFTTTLALTSYLYVGHSKPIGAAYCEISTVNTVANVLAFQYWNGATWTTLTTARDLTKGLTRSGWVSWDRPSDWAAHAVNGVTAFWVRAAPSVLHTATVLSGLNLIFADDFDLKTEFPNVQDAAFLPSGAVSHINTHVAVRNQMIQDLRNKGYIKTDLDGNWINLIPWDLHDVEEVRQAATSLALSKIFFQYSDNPQDHWMAKSTFYEAKYKATLELLKVSFDADDDGEVDSNEQGAMTVSRMYR